MLRRKCDGGGAGLHLAHDGVDAGVRVQQVQHAVEAEGVVAAGKAEKASAGEGMRKSRRSGGDTTQANRTGSARGGVIQT
eukprot:2373186-Pyramimonas_sp.AAC.2